MVASIKCSLFLAGFLFQEPLSQKRGSTFFPLQDTDPTPSFGGFGLRINKLGQPKLALERIKTIDVPLPPIDEQREMDATIIEVDQTIDQARAELKALVSLRAVSSDSLINGRISMSI